MHVMRLPLVAGVMIVCFASLASAEVSLPAIFSDGMVLQRHKPVTIWGTAEAGAEVTVRFGGQERSATADGEGRWRVSLAAMEASSEGRGLRVAAGGEVIELADVLVGEVWIGSGQSNMEWTMNQISADEDIAAAADEGLRLFTVQRGVAEEPRGDMRASASWRAASAESVRPFSAVAYYFGQVLRRELEGDVPVGLIVSAWGGTPAEAWTPLDALEAEPRLSPLLERWGNQIDNDAGQANSPHRPANLYNAMIAPMTDLSLRGVIWYQGESNVPRAAQYRTLFPLMIESWRQAFGQGDFPFLFVQIAPFRYHEAWNRDPADAAELWEAQMLTLKSVANTGMAVTTDISQVDDIHPVNKVDVGRRLARWALAYTYNMDVVPSGPIYTHHAIEGEAVRLHFDYAAGLRSSDSQALTHFTVAGRDGEFHPATAEIDGETIVVRSEQVGEPIAVRFAWHDSAEPNLVNGVGLPASPFRTDSLPLGTRGNH